MRCNRLFYKKVQVYYKIKIIKSQVKRSKNVCVFYMFTFKNYEKNMTLNVSMDLFGEETL